MRRFLKKRSLAIRWKMGCSDIRLKGCKVRGDGGLDQEGAREKWIVLNIFTR